MSELLLRELNHNYLNWLLNFSNLSVIAEPENNLILIKFINPNLTQYRLTIANIDCTNFDLSRSILTISKGNELIFNPIYLNEERNKMHKEVLTQFLKNYGTDKK